jgi:hypothetical protein
MTPRRVFLSHTSDLREYPSERSFVSAAEAAVARAGDAVEDMAYFTARNEKPAAYCENRVEASEIYVGIVGFEYGSPVRDRPDISYTELEFDAAGAAGLPRLIFLQRRESGAEGIKDDTRQMAFRQRLRDRADLMVASFDSPLELELLLYQALMELSWPTRGSRAVRSRIDPRMRIIQQVLQQSRRASPEFGRPAGPIWSDFELGHHPFSTVQYAAVTDALDAYRFHLVRLPEAHWRRQFVLYLGWRFATDGHTVHYTDASRWSVSSELAGAITELDADRAVVIVENVHQIAPLCEDVLGTLVTSTSSIRCLFAADPSFEEALVRGPYFTSELADLPTSSANSYELASALMVRYAKEKLGRQLGPRNTAHFLSESQWQRSFSLFFGDHRPPEERSYNLWLLLAQLRAWDGQQIPTRRSLDRTAADFVSRQVVEPLLRKGTEIASLSAAVAFLQDYGVAPSIHFLTRTLGFTAREATTAQESGILRFNNRRAELSDQWLPRALCEAAKVTPEIMSDLTARLRIGRSDAGDELLDLLSGCGLSNQVHRATLAAYLVSGEPGYDLLLLNWTATLDQFSLAVRNAVGPAALQALPRLIRGEQSVMALGRALLGLARVDEALAEQVANALDPDHLVDLMAAASSIKDIAWLLEGLRTASPAKAQQLARHAGVRVLEPALHATTRLGHVASLIWAWRRADEVTAAELIVAADHGRLARLIAKTDDIGAIGWLLLATSGISEATTSDLLALIAPSDLAQAVTASTYCRDVACLLWGLAQAAPSFASELVSIVGHEHFREFVSVEPNLRFTALLLRALVIADRRVALHTVAKLDAASQRRRLQDAPTDAAAMYLQALAAVSPRMRRQLGEVIQDIRMEYRSAKAAEHMFSTMDPTAMAMAGQRARRAQDRLLAIEAYAAIVASDHDRPRFGSPDAMAAWLWTLWEYEPERCFTVIARNWPSLAATLRELTTLLTQAQLSIMLRSVNPEGFTSLANALPRSAFSRTRILDVRRTIALSEGALFRGQTMRMLLRRYTCSQDDAESMLQAEGETEVAATIPRLATVAPHLVSPLTRALSWETITSRHYGSEDVFTLALRLRPDCQARVLGIIRGEAEGGSNRDNPCDHVERACTVLAMYPHSGRLDPQDAAVLRSLLTQAAVADAVAKCNSLKVITTLLRQLRSLDETAASDIAAALDHDDIASRVVAEPSVHTLGEFLTQIAQPNPVLLDRLVSATTASFPQRPADFAAALLAAVQHSRTVSAKFTSRLVDPSSLRALMTRQDSLAWVGALLKAVAKHNLKLAKDVLDEFAEDTRFLSLLAAANLSQLNALLLIVTQIDALLASKVAASLGAADLTRQVGNASVSAIKEAIAILAPLNPDLVRGVRDAVIWMSVPRQVEHDIVDLTDISEILECLQATNPPLLAMYVAGIDLESLASLLRGTDQQYQYLWGLDRFTRAIAYADLQTAVMLHRLAPDVVTADILRAAALDATGQVSVAAESTESDSIAESASDADATSGDA